MVQLRELVSYSDELLDAASFQDYCPNGLQVEGRPEVHLVVSGVTASLALIDAAVARNADAVLVHHGYFWKGEDPCITGMKCERIRRLLDAGISLLAYHLPLDAHPELGNNVQLARRLGIDIEGSFGDGPGPALGLYGSLPAALSAQDFAAHIGAALGRAPLHIGGTGDVQRIGWCTGAAQQYIEKAAEIGLDAYLSGEISEPTVHVARETGIHYFSAGHHVTERYGVQALGTHLAEHFGLAHEFVDIDNPV